MSFEFQIILKSMHKYKPRIHVILHSPLECVSQTLLSLPAEGVYTFSFPETQFTTVTAYQNQQVTVVYFILDSYKWKFLASFGSAFM